MSEKIYSTLSDFQSGDFENLDRPVVKYNESIDLDLKNFQYVNQFIKHLPYFDKTKKNALQEFVEIKSNLAKALILNELRPGLVHWTSRLQTYINEFGLFFTKDDHIKLIKIYLQVIVTPQIDLVLVEMSFSLLTELLKKYFLLKRDDLRIDWRPLYTLFRRIHKIDEKSAVFAPDNIEQISFLNFISFARIYFDESSVSEMLEEWRPLMCPFDMSMNYAFDRFSLFLPTILLDQGHSLNFWLREFLDLWLNFSGKVYWETNILSLFSRAAKDCVGLFDWTCYIPYIFSKLLRGLGLTMVNSITLNIDDNTPKNSINLINGFLNTFSYSDIEIDSIGLWIVSMIGTGSDRNSCMQHIKKLFHILRSYYYPSNDGQLDNFFSLLQRIPEALIERIRFEKLKKYEWLREGRDTESFIQPSDIEELVLCLKDIVLKGLFSKNNFNDAIKTFQYLCFLRADLMLPTLIDQVYESFEINVQPHRYTPLLACLVSVPRELVSYDQSVDTQKHVLHLLISVLPGIDLNDLNKLILTFQFLTNMLSHIIVCDCTPALKIRGDLTDYDKDVCLMTANFVDFIHSLFSRLFTFIDHLASDNSVDVSDTAHQASYYSRVSSALTDENVTQVHIVQMLNVLVNQSSSLILKVIVDKTFNYLNGRVFNAKSGEIIVYLIGSLVSSSYGRKAFEKFFQYLYENMVCLLKIKNYGEDACV
ncbi:proteasome activator complex subunit 4 isoform X2 [Brachionus plicatilis]|uniref:Proteasome activator complex subunit 4 isoform X2 n=1 Tax=Brachionus plicatilis TaxID=10195 RepID=A0A3M7SLF1_BRAPC|nr:proteasome activator complex subunit 4 isoform X2 [Brachionus plicatilis]